jgi:predicted ester cyclase
VHREVVFNSKKTTLSDFTAAIVSNIEAVPNIHWEIQTIVVDHQSIAVRLQDTGTPTATWLDILPRGKSFKANEFAMYKISEGKISEMWFLFDVPSIQSQLKV